MIDYFYYIRKYTLFSYRKKFIKIFQLHFKSMYNIIISDYKNKQVGGLYMWTRYELKSKAKVQMKGRYWNYLGVSLIPTLAQYVVNIPITAITYLLVLTGVISSKSNIFQFDNFSEQYFENLLDNMETGEFIEFFKTFFASNIFSLIANILIPILVMWPIAVGITRWFIRARESRNLSMNLVFTPFRKDQYLKVIGAMLYQSIFLFLWYLLFWIPGIIKSYSYRMIPYILADNPNIGAKRALKLSSSLTYGHKMDIFILDLSFIGWYLLGFMACCIGVVAVVPYYNATMAELYENLKKEGVQKGLCSMEELGYVPVRNNLDQTDIIFS